MTKTMEETPITDDDFETLLVEAWARCADDETLRASPAYGSLREWLATLSPSCRLQDPNLTERLGRVVCALRTCDEDRLMAELRCAALDRSDQKTDDDGGDADADEEDTRYGCVPYQPLELMQKPPPIDVANCGLIAALDASDECMGLQRFFREVAAHTCDRGTLLKRVTDDVLYDFRSFVESVFGNRVTQIAMVLAREQMAIQDRYAELESRTLNRAQLILSSVRDLMPTFDWRRYSAEPGYIKVIVESRCPEDTYDAEADNARAKQMLYQLNWLRSEIDRAECQNHLLKEQYTAMSTELASINRDISDVYCKTASETAKLSNELDQLRAQSANQVCAIDKLMEKIQILLNNTTSESKT